MKLKPELPPADNKSTSEIILERTGVDIALCPFCKIGKMEEVDEIPEGTGLSAFHIIWEARNRDGP